MNANIKWFLFAAYAVAWSFLLYSGKVAEPFLIYTQVSFPICLIVLFYYIQHQNSDLRSILDYASKFIGQIIVLSSIPSLVITIATSFLLPYFFLITLYSKLGISRGWSFALAIPTPIILIILSGIIYKKIKGMQNRNQIHEMPRK